MSPEPYKKLGYARHRQIHELIADHSRVADGVVTYDRGWSDAVIAEALTEDFWAGYPGPRGTAVARFRQTHVGKLRDFRYPRAAKAAAPEPALNDIQAAAVRAMITEALQAFTDPAPRSQTPAPPPIGQRRLFGR